MLYALYIYIYVCMYVCMYVKMTPSINSSHQVQIEVVSRGTKTRKVASVVHSLPLWLWLAHHGEWSSVDGVTIIYWHQPMILIEARMSVRKLTVSPWVH